jgi:hypothetical protein
LLAPCMLSSFQMDPKTQRDSLLQTASPLQMNVTFDAHGGFFFFFNTLREL